MWTSLTTANRMFLQYNAGLNRFIIRMRTNSVNFDKQLPLHSNNSVTGTGASSGNTWTSSNRGNTNANGYTMITVTYDASQTTGANAFKIYWNTGELTSGVISNSGTRTNNALGKLTVFGQSNSTNNGWNGRGDEWAFYNKVLTSGEVSTLYNSGTIKAAQQLSTTNLIENLSFDTLTTNNVTSYANRFTSVSYQNGATNFSY